MGEQNLLYRPGDRVIVRPDLKRNTRYYMLNGSETFNAAVDDMFLLAGKIVTISDIWLNGQYHVEGSTWSWTDEMFLGPYTDPHLTAVDLSVIF